MSALPPELRNAVHDFCAVSRGREVAARRAAQTSCYRRGAASLDVITDRDDVAAYLTARLPATYAAIRTALLALLARAPGFTPASVLDFGCGPGTASWAAAEIWPDIGSFVMQDHNAQFVEAARTLAQASQHAVLRNARLVHSAGFDGSHDRYDLVLAGYLISEIPEQRVQEYVARLWSICAGALVVVEPGTPRGFQRMLRCRDALRLEGGQIAAPCPANSDCPIQGSDWCHFSVRLPRSREHMRAKDVRVPYEDEKFSYIAAVRGTVALAPSAPRIIAPVISGKAGSRFRLCSGEAISEIEVPRRDKPAYRLHSRKDWGDVF